MTVVTLQAEPTQSAPPTFYDEQRHSRLGLITFMAGLGLVPQLLHVPDVVFTSTANESTYTDRAPATYGDFQPVVDVLSMIHNSLLVDATELDPAARDVLSRHLWDLYVS